MRIVVLDGYTENPGDLSWSGLGAFGEVTVYDRTSYTDAPIIAERIGDAEVAVKMSERLYQNGVYATGFFYPVVPMGKARIRTQMSAAHTPEDIDFAIEAFAKSR